MEEGKGCDFLIKKIIIAYLPIRLVLAKEKDKYSNKN
jgi:hypothetical protein